MGMLGLATVLTEQGMEGIVPFVPPASVRPKAAEPAVDVSADDASEISMGTWILVGVIVAVVMASALGYWISVKTAAPQRNKAVMTGSIKDLSSAPPRTLDAAASRAQADTVSAVAAVASQPEPAASRTESPPMTRNPARAAARQSAQSVFVPNPEWSSRVRRIGDVDPVTERSTMVILDAIHDVQERERQSRPAASKEVGREH
ncbi:MAG: hypothetical protein C0492_14120 [Verminephrobacter sp.]|nr:hypothetical protein [Verminephrobacter sp.]